MKNPLTPKWLETPPNLSELDPRIWPRTAKRNARGELTVGDQTASHLVRQFGSPLYVVDQEDFESRLLISR